mmetsp:Transcript_13057/g.21601  ORF Transcript_13057/g.21601 Transcript_13057/m.21601 type:complete len:511 (+) Transcript_13057:94-1626(+)|eukprot:CAMPEP_0119004422 /NCGR_PEP_ID=MMETSP1176-20130426/1129_1 /TAXON_ID=265551 /ORGANISM="Synedropsis recta cf, Strain CCMP1620" /LENGTH=510 /DNA_ID=CAMNT_0006956121 /DNA_START=104 /DNA_END=1636 /DNA_ORIENTATION=+
MPSETSTLLPKSVGVLREQLKEASGSNGKLEKSEFKRLLLGRGIFIKQAVIDEIFTACDVDGDGSLTVDEIFTYVDTLQPKTSVSDAMQYTVHKTTTSVVWWFAVAFHFAAWVGLVSFYDTETGKHMRPEWSLVGAWFFFFGAIYFFKLLLDYESSSYDTTVQAKIILKNCVDKDPSFFDRKSGEDASMDQYELNAVLEEQALYLPKLTVAKMFAEIDADKGGVISKDNIVNFSKTLKTDPSSEERQKAINEAVVHTWGFWSLICWFIGSILFLVAAHLSYAGYTEPPLPKNTYFHLYGMGSVMYFLLAVCMLPMLDCEVKGYLESIEQMSKAFAQRRQRNQDTSDAQLFRSLDVGQADESLDVTELYDVLIEEGVLIPYDTFLELFKSADESGDGKLQVGEFTKFIANMKIAKDPWQYRVQMANRSPFSPSFFGWLMFFVGGIFYVMGSYIDPTRGAWWYFGGAVCFTLASGKSVFGTVKGHWLQFYSIEAGKAEFKAHITGHGMPGVV